MCTTSVSRQVIAICAALLAGLASARAAEPPPKTLREAAAGRFLVGVALSSRRLEDPKFGTFVADQFSALTAENEMKPASLQPAKGRFEFAGGDKLAAFAAAHEMKLVGHTLCWHQQTPAWMFEDEQKQPLGREAALANLRAHIDAVAGHFKGKVIGWDVVNEAISDKAGEYLRDTPARRAIGDDFIARAFEFTRAADPGAELYYNDYGIENPQKRDKVLKLIRDLKSRGLRIDAVGIQAHFSLRDAQTAQKLDEAIAAYATAGVKVSLTELDVDVLPRAGRGGAADLNAREATGLDPYKEGLPAEVAEAQAKFYRQIFEVVLKHRGTVERVTFWGTHDGASWLNNFPVRGRTNHPLLWDRELQAKPAFAAVLAALNAAGK
jgi:endo-1,4-beta-xylanase